MTAQTLPPNNLAQKESGNTLFEILRAVAELVGRTGLASLFLCAGPNKVMNYEGNSLFLGSVGLLESVLLISEFLGAILLIVGFHTRIVALAFAGFCVISTQFYHNDLNDQIQFLMFFQNISVAGGLLLLSANGAGPFSADTELRSLQKTLEQIR